MLKRLQRKIRRQGKGKQVIFASVCLLICILLLSLYIGRGYVRNVWVPRQVNRVYAPSVNATFNRIFGPLNTAVKPPLKIPVMKTPSSTGSTDTCSEAYFEGFSETVECGVNATINVQDSPSLEARWNQNAAALAAYLANRGWIENKTNNPAALNQLFAKRNIVAGATYTMQAGKEDCSVDFFYDNIGNANQGPDSMTRYIQANELTVYEHCGREIKLFGGSYQP